MAASTVVKSEVKREGGQMRIESSLNAGTATEVDHAIAEMFYGLNIASHKINHPLVKNAFNVMRTAPASYMLPSRDRMGYDLLDSTALRLQVCVSVCACVCVCAD